MKRILITIFILAFLAIPTYGALTNSVDVDASQITSYWWTGEPLMDIAWKWSKEVEDILEGGTAIGSLFFDPTDTAPDTDEGVIYYNDTANNFVFYNGSSWVTMGTSSGGDSLDTAYNNGVGITVDNGAVTLTATDAANNVVFAIVQSDTGTSKGFTITNAGTGNTIDIQGQASSKDIEGTGDTWNVSSVGLGTFKGGLTINTGGELLVSARDVLFDDTYDVAWDTSADMLIFQDNAVLGLGGDHDGAADITITGDGTNVLIEAVSDNWGQVRIGSTHAMDWAFYGSTNSKIALFDASAAEFLLNGYDIRLSDDDLLTFGDSSSSDSFVMDFDETTDNLIIVATTANDAVQVGDGTTNTDLKLMGTTASTFVLFDSSSDEMFYDLADLKISDQSQIEFVDASDNVEWAIDNVTAETLLFTPTETTDDQTINFGNATNTTDFRLFGATASTVVYDASADRVIFDVYDIEINDTSNLIIGSDDEWTIDNSSEVLRIIASDSTDDFSVILGVTTEGVDLKVWGATGTEYVEWDASADSFTVVGDLALFTLTGTTLPFHVNVTGTVAGVAAQLETTNGGIKLLADGSDNGDIDLDSEDDMTFTCAGDLVFAVTGAITLPDDVIRKTTVAVTAVQADNLRATPKELVAAEAGKMHEFVKVIVAIDWGATAYTESDDNLAVRYENTTGVVVSDVIEATGLADATEDTVCFAGPAPTTSALVTEANSTNKALVLHNTGNGEWGNSGDSPLVIITYYRTHTTAELGL